MQSLAYLPLLFVLSLLIYIEMAIKATIPPEKNPTGRSRGRGSADACQHVYDDDDGDRRWDLLAGDEYGSSARISARYNRMMMMCLDVSAPGKTGSDSKRKRDSDCGAHDGTKLTSGREVRLRVVRRVLFG